MRHLALSSTLLLSCLIWAEEPRLAVLFLGDRGHHRPAERCQQVLAPLTARGIDLHYSERLADLTTARLAHYDGLLVYGNLGGWSDTQEQAVMEFVAQGGGLAAIHSASACFPRSERWTALVGGRFLRHGTGTFRTTPLAPRHPVMAGLEPFESWDETYVHDRLSADRVVLSVREDGDAREPWTWVRFAGAGRVFYTAWGHDHRTWGNEGFHRLLARGIRWSCGDDAPGTGSARSPFVYETARVPLYEHGGQSTQAEMQRPLDPEASLRRMRTPPELEVQLFSAEPDVSAPIAMTWDARGRLWIAETYDYPNELARDGRGRDRIKICEDTDGDGRADQFTVFADGLSIPTSLAFGGGGLIVAQAPHMLLLIDSDGDDHADEQRVLFSGFSTSDTHAGPSNLRYGHDGWMWGTLGYAGFRGRVGDEEHSFRQGIFRFRTDGSQLEFVASTTNNTWGLGFSEDGLVFASTANGNPSVHAAIPNRYHERVPGWSPGPLQSIVESARFHPITARVRQVDWHGQFTAAAGHALYTARAFPEEYWNRAAFVCGPTGHLVGRLFLDRSGTRFIARDGWNLLASDDEWTAPIAAEVGPDGAVWVLDWYSYIVQHNPTPHGFERGAGNAYVTPLRDRTHGRIYRVAPRGAPPRPPRRDLTAATTADLVAALASDNMLWRLTAQRLLVEGDHRDAEPALVRLVVDPRVDSVGLAPAAQHAVAILDQLGCLADSGSRTRSTVIDALAHPAAGVRRAAMRALPREAETVDLLLRRGLLADAEAGTRLETFLALSEMPPSAAAGRAVFQAAQDVELLEDRWLADAVTFAAAQHDEGFLRALMESLTRDSVADTPAPSQPNLLPNPSFEARGTDGRPTGWQVRHYSGKAEHHASGQGRNGSGCLTISSTTGADSSWFAEVSVQPDTIYELSGWVRTDSLEVRGTAEGALFNVHELQGAQRVMTQHVRGDSEWTRVECTFDSRNRTRLSVNCLLGGWGPATGLAFFDDLELVQISEDALPGKLGGMANRVLRAYAARAPEESIVPVLQAMAQLPESLAVRWIEVIAANWPADQPLRLDATARLSLAAALRALADSGQPTVLTLAERWSLDAELAAHRDGVISQLRAVIASSAATVEQRAVAARRLLDLADGEDAVATVLEPIAESSDLELVTGLLRSLSASRCPGAGPAVLSLWSKLTPAAREIALEVLCLRTEWTHALLTAVTDGPVLAGEIPGERWLQLEQHPDDELAALAEQARGGAREQDRAEIVERLLPAASRTGDALRGAEVFASSCASCHRLGGKGGLLGPPLDGVRARPRVDTLLAILDPNSSVEATYRLWTVQTTTGTVHAGRLDAETKTTVEILDFAGQRHVIPRNEIAGLQASPVSLMPESFDLLGEESLADLLEFLSTR